MTAWDYRDGNDPNMYYVQLNKPIVVTGISPPSISAHTTNDEKTALYKSPTFASSQNNMHTPLTSTSIPNEKMSEPNSPVDLIDLNDVHNSLNECTGEQPKSVMLSRTDDDEPGIIIPRLLQETSNAEMTAEENKLNTARDITSVSQSEQDIHDLD